MDSCGRLEPGGHVQYPLDGAGMGGVQGFDWPAHFPQRPVPLPSGEVPVGVGEVRRLCICWAWDPG